MLCEESKVSVIIPVYNVEQYLEECLKSVITQTLKDIEIICVNDGSTDNSWAILQKYASQYKNIVLMNQMNRGAGAARNEAIKIAKGEFVAFMDSDDYYPSNDVLECLYDSAKAQNVLICGGSSSQLNSGTILSNFEGIRKKFFFQSDRIIKYEDYQYPYGFWRFIYNLDMLKANNVYFPAYRRYEDPPFMAKAMCVAGSFYEMKKMTYIYRTGIKVINWTPENIGDAMNGVLDLLNISREQKMSTLHANTAESIYNGFLVPIVPNLLQGNSKVRELLQRINQAMDRDLLKKEGRNIEEYYIPDMHEVVKMIKVVQEKKTAFMKQLQLFDEVIIYGAGLVGNEVADYVKQLPGIKIKCFAVSTGMMKPDMVSGIPVKAIDELVGDRKKVLVLIATLDNIQQEIKTVLAKLDFRHVLPINYKEFRFYGIEVPHQKSIEKT